MPRLFRWTMSWRLTPCKTGFSRPGRLSPKNKIQKVNPPHSTGRKLIGKISPDRFGHGFDLSKEFPLQHLAASSPFPFRFLG